MAFDPKKYPVNWREVVAAIRARSGDRCECSGECGLHAGRRCGLAQGSINDFMRGRVVLTTAHLNGPGGPCRCDPKCGKPEHLKHMCQRCHLRYDHPRHVRNARRTRRARLAVRDLFPEGGE